jgi:hypothetical protein
MPLRSAVILVAILAMFACPSFAQSVTGGVKAGANFSKIVFGGDEDDEDLDHKTGLVAGAFINVPMTELFSFHPEFLYSMKGGKEERVGGDIKMKLDFLQFPLLFRANFAADTTRAFVVFGPAFGFRTRAEIEGPDERDVDITDETEVVEFSGVIGAGVQFGQVIFEVRYDHGFNDLDKNEPAEARTRTISVLVGFDFARFRNP